MNLTSRLSPLSPATAAAGSRSCVVCLAQLMIVLDTTIVNVALPSIQHDLHFTQGNLTWVVNAFLVTFGSFLLLAGRLGDLVGRKRVFLAGVVVFTVASAAVRPRARPGPADRRPLRPGHRRRAAGLGDPRDHRHRVPASARARPRDERLRVRLRRRRLARPARRRRCSPQALSWHWIFFVNLPIGVATFALGRALIPGDTGLGLGHGVDWLGSVLVTASLMTRVYAIVAGDQPRLGLRRRCSASARSPRC